MPIHWLNYSIKKGRHKKRSASRVAR